jgi:predicted ATPase/class 3 adenylate cyclase
VTVVFADVTGSTSMGESMDPEAVRQVMERYFETAAEVLERHGGTVEKFIGDAVMAIFGVPLLHEDDALRAVRAAHELRAELATLNAELDRDWGITLQARIGVNTGEVVAGDSSRGHTLVTGDAVNVAARLEQLAAPGEILVGDATHRLTANAVTAEPVEPLQAHGKTQPVSAWRLAEVHDEQPYRRRMDTPLVDREDELSQLRSMFARVVRQRSSALFTVIGPAGIGKSRLTQEFLRTVADEATVLRGRCLPYGDGITYWPLVEVIRRAAGADARDGVEEVMRDEPDGAEVATLVSGLVGQSEVAGNPDESAWAARRLFEALARERPLVVAFEDVHWAEPTMLDLIEQTVEWIREAPVMVVCDARDELIEERPTWGGGLRNASTVFLEPLSDADADQLVSALAPDAALDGQTREAVLRLAAGNPLFVEQLLATIAAQGRPDVSALSTIHAVIGARLDALTPQERTVIECASVIGKEFPADALTEMLGRDHVETQTTLQALGRRDLLRRTRSPFHGASAYRFGHMLVRDAAYGRIPKRIRADLHERFAGWIERGTGMRESEVGEIIGYHLEQAYVLRSELGPPDDATRRLGLAAARELMDAGLRALRRFDGPAAENLLGRARRMLPPDDDRHAVIVADLAVALAWSERDAEGLALLDEELSRTEARNDRRAAAHASLGRAYVGWLSAGTDVDLAGAAADAIPAFEAAGDARGLVKAWLYRGHAYQAASQYGQATDAFEHARAQLAVAGRVPEERAVFGNLALSLWAGPTPGAEAIERCRALIDKEREAHPTSEAQLALPLAMLLADVGRTDEARELLGRLQAMFQAAPGPTRAEASNYVGVVQATCGDLLEAAQSFTTAIALLEEFSDSLTISYATARMALLLCDLGRPREAHAYAGRSRAAAAAADIEAQIFWRVALARSLAHLGRAAEALPLAEEAVELSEQTDSPGRKGDAALVSAEVLELAGRPEGSRAAAARALEHYAAKGITAFDRQVNTLLDRSAGTSAQ